MNFAFPQVGPVICLLKKSVNLRGSLMLMYQSRQALLRRSAEFEASHLCSPPVGPACGKSLLEALHVQQQGDKGSPPAVRAFVLVTSTLKAEALRVPGHCCDRINTLLSPKSSTGSSAPCEGN